MKSFLIGASLAMNILCFSGINGLYHENERRLNEIDMLMDSMVDLEKNYETRIERLEELAALQQDREQVRKQFQENENEGILAERLEWGGIPWRY